MTYHNGWRVLSSRIKGIVQSGHLHAAFRAALGSNAYGIAEVLRKSCEDTVGSIKEYRNNSNGILPFSVAKRIDDFLKSEENFIKDDTGSRDSKEGRVAKFLVSLCAFEAEVSYLLSDGQAVIRALCERAFSHLQRSIVADPTFREKWTTAFKSGEVECEKLGAVHLLLHGIWAFKINAEGERTDLVFQEPIRDPTDERFVDGLVLTEWKVEKGNNSTKCFEKARDQAKRYARGSLAGSELRRYRYAVVVSEAHLEVPDDIKEGDVVYRHINIAVAPTAPSK